jgi:hypothetical protein
MKKIVSLILFFLLTLPTYSQGVFFNLGKNFSSFSYKNKSADTEKLRLNGVGDAYEIGYTDVLKFKKFKNLNYTRSITINDFNASAVSNLNKLEWETTYLGVQSTVDYQFYYFSSIFLCARTGLSVSTILRGKQEINNSSFNLVRNTEFSGIILQPAIGLYAKYYLTSNGYLSAGLNLSKSLKLGNNSDNVSINNSQILFGGYFDLIKK